MLVDELNGNMEADEELIEEPKVKVALLLPAAEAEDPPNGNPIDGAVGFNAEPNAGGLFVCQLELNKLEVLTEVLGSDKETVELSPPLLDPNSLAGVEEPNRELPELKAAAPVIPNSGGEADKPNGKVLLGVEDAIPVSAEDDDGWVETKEPLPEPKRVGPGDWLLAFEKDEPLKPKMPVPVLAVLEDAPPRD